MLRNNGRHNFRSPFGIQPSLVLDFAGTTTLDSRITFTRSTTATYTNSSGVLTNAAINTPRFNYNPSTLQSLGLLIDQSSTNILLNSLLDGTNLTTQTVTTTATPYTLSFYGTGTIVLTGTNISTQTGTGAYPSRKTFTFTPTAGPLTLTVIGTVQYAQLEALSFASSFIPTGASQVTRGSDQTVILDVSGIYNPTQGTILVQGTQNTNFGQNYPLASFSDGSLTNKFYTEIYGATTTGSVQNSGTLNGQGVGSIGTPFKMALAAQTNDAQLCTNGTLNQSSSSLTMPPNISELDIGCFINFGSQIRTYTGCISKIAYYPIRVTNDQLQALTGS